MVKEKSILERYNNGEDVFKHKEIKHHLIVALY